MNSNKKKEAFRYVIII